MDSCKSPAKISLRTNLKQQMPKEKILKNNLTSEEYDVLEKMMKSDL